MATMMKPQLISQGGVNREGIYPGAFVQPKPQLAPQLISLRYHRQGGWQPGVIPYRGASLRPKPELAPPFMSPRYHMYEACLTTDGPHPLESTSLSNRLAVSRDCRPRYDCYYKS